MKRTVFALTLISALLFLAVAGTQLIHLSEANPHFFVQEGQVSPPPDVDKPIISIFSPQNNSMYASSNVSLDFNAKIVVPTLPELWYVRLILSEVYYKASWLPNNTYLDIEAVRNSAPHTRFSSEDNYARWNTHWAIRGYELSPIFSVNLKDVPEGTHSLEVFAVLGGLRETSQSGGITHHYGWYVLVGSSTVNFTIDSTPPTISVLSVENKTYYTTDIELDFAVNEPVSQITYTLDGQENVTVTGNTTLTGLPNGDHKGTVYATDEAGNIGASETIYFNIMDPFPTELVTVAGASVSFVSVGLVVYRVKIKKRTEKL